MEDTIKLQKFLAQAGVCSRRKGEELIEQGKVRIDNRVATLGDRVNPTRQKIYLSGNRVVLPEGEHVYLMLNKPRDVVTTVSDDRGRATVMELVRGVPGRIFPVGRLDYASEGLLLLTDDGDFAYALMHPSHQCVKTYEATVAGMVSEQQLNRLRLPFVLDGKATRPAQVVVIGKTESRTKLMFQIGEGRNRQIRRMCEQVGLEVRRLKRVAIGDLMLGDVKSGQYRSLSKKEVDMLLTACRTGGETDD